MTSSKDLRLEKNEIFDGKNEDYNVWLFRLNNRFKEFKFEKTLLKTPNWTSRKSLTNNSTARKNKTWRRCFATTTINAFKWCTVLRLVLEILTVKETITKLNSFYQRKGIQIIASLRQQLINLRFRNFSNLNDLFHAFDEIHRDMASANYIVDHRDKVFSLLDVIPQTFKHLVDHFEIIADENFKNLDIDTIKRKLINAELKASRCGENPMETSAFVAGSINDNIKSRLGPKVYSYKNNFKKNFKCYKYGGKGHKAFECPSNDEEPDEDNHSKFREKFTKERQSTTVWKL